jgi:phosphatidate cytidylyltransferase
LSVGTILASVINNLSLPDQLELLERILTYFVNQGVLDPTVLQKYGASALTESARQVLESGIATATAAAASSASL